jgi:hypothetical protein
MAMLLQVGQVEVLEPVTGGKDGEIGGEDREGHAAIIPVTAGDSQGNGSRQQLGASFRQ